MHALVIAAGMQIGRWLRRLWSTDEESLGEKVVIDTAMGLGVLSLVIFTLGALQLFRFTRAFSAILAVVAVWGVVGLVQEYRRNRNKPAQDSGPLSRQLYGILFIILFLAALIPAMLPASMGDWDSLAYHLTVPKLYLQQGGIYRIDIMSHSHFPMLAEMLYIPGLAFRMPGAAKMAGFWIAVLLVGAVAVLAARLANVSHAERSEASRPDAEILRPAQNDDGARNDKYGGMAALAIAGVPMVLWEATTGYIDTATALYMVVAVYFLLGYLDKPERRSLVGCAVAAGFAASTKMTGLAVIPLLAIWLVVDRYAGERRIEWKPAALLVGVALLVCSPWYVKSWIYTGNPVFPFFYSAFGGRGWTPALAHFYAEQQARFGMGHGAASFLLLPYDLTFSPGAFYDNPGLYVGPLLLAALPVLLFARYRSPKLKGLFLFFLANVAIWFALTQQSRYLIPTFALLGVLVSVLVGQDDRFRRARAALTAVFVATALFGAWTLAPLITSAAPLVFGQETQDEYLSRAIDTYPAASFINTSLPTGARIALFGDTRGFFIDRQFVWADPGHNVEFDRSYSSPAELAAYLKSRGVTHALVNFGPWVPTRAKATGVWKMVYEAIEGGHFEEVYPRGEGQPRVGVYRVR
jgi:hypothetical protein